ncbi:MAG TPA: WXG100 family type VII secretion target, partial [Candidatus Dormibacteraeota bacterium]
MGQTWNGDLVHDAGNVVSDIGGWFSGPPGDPGRIRQAAGQLESLGDRLDRDRRGLNEAIDELTRSWQGDGATQFHETWYGAGGGAAPATVMADAHTQLAGFVRNLRDYADKLEQAQNEHWIQMGILAALTVVNVAQLGADPATDAAEVGVAATTEVA